MIMMMMAIMVVMTVMVTIRMLAMVVMAMVMTVMGFLMHCYLVCQAACRSLGWPPTHFEAESFASFSAASFSYSLLMRSA